MFWHDILLCEKRIHLEINKVSFIRVLMRCIQGVSFLHKQDKISSKVWFRGTFSWKTLNYSLGRNYGPPTHFNFLKSRLKKLWFFKYHFLLHKTGSLHLEDLVTSHFQICKCDAVVCYGLYPLSQYSVYCAKVPTFFLLWFSYSARVWKRDTNPWL
jgi:hypothetical protein